MNPAQLSSDLQIIINAITFIQGIMPNGISSGTLALLQKIQGNQDLLSFVSSLINALAAVVPAESK